MNEAPFSTLPEYWQQHIHYLRTDRATLRKRLPAAKTTDAIQKLRQEIVRMRLQRNEARAELEALRAELETSR